MLQKTSAAFACAIGISCALGLTSAPAANAQDASNFPTRNITLVVPYAAGGPPDVASRIIANYLTQALGRQVIVENRAGASTTVGTRSVARATPDGHTLMMADVTFPVAVNLIANAGYDPRKDFEPIAPVLRTFMGLVVHPDVPAKDAKELVALAKSKPGTLKYGTSGLGSPPYLGALVFINASGIDMLHVPYRGVALALNDVVAGHLSLAFMSQSTAGSQLAAGKVRVLGVYGDKRVSSIPDVPTFREQGFDTRIADQGVWFGIITTGGTPRDIVMKLNKAVNDALRDPTTKAALEKADYNLTGGTPEELKALIDEHTVYWADSLRKAGVKPEEAKP